jgi:hypothetical protein
MTLRPMSIMMKSPYSGLVIWFTAFCQNNVPIGYKYISGVRTNNFDNFANVPGEVKRKN